MVIVFIGPPGCGKGTQANILKESILPDLNILTVSSLLKEKSQDESILGKDIKNKMDNGDLIEDTIVISVLKEKVNTLLKKTRDKIKSRGSIVKEITTKGDFIKKIGDHLKKNQNNEYLLEVVSLRDSKTAESIIVDLNITGL